MGAKYSSGSYPKGFKDGLLKNLDINAVRLKVYTYEKIKRGRQTKYNDLFIAQSEVQYMFNLSPRQSHELFQLLDHEQLRRIPVYDLWGCLVLACNNSLTEKVEFLFDILDTNRDGFVSKYDLENMFVCATRGFARLKGISPPPVASLKDIAKKSLQAKATILNEKGEIGVIDLKVFMMSSDSCRKYFSNLGTNVEMKDENKLLQQRMEMINELLEVEFEMKQIELTETIKEEDIAVYNKERGGDEQLVRINESQMARLGTAEDRTNEDFDNIRKSLTAKADIKAEALEAQYARRAHRENTTEPEGNMNLRDAVAFSAGRHCKPAPIDDNVASISDQAFIFRWSKLPQDADGLTNLDIDIIEDLFEASGVLMTDSDAQKCLAAIKPNQLGRYDIEDVMNWHRDFILWESVRKPLFREVAEGFSNTIDGIAGNISQFLEVISVQKQYAAHCVEIKEKIKAMEEKLKRLNEKPLEEAIDSISSDLDEEHDGSSHHNHHHKKPHRHHRTRSPTNTSKSEGKEKKGIQLNVVKDQLVGSVRLAAWQRQQVLNAPSKAELKATFGIHSDKPKGVQRATAEGDSSPSKKKKGSPLNKKASLVKTFVKSPKKETVGDDKTPIHWKMNFKFQFILKPLMDNRVNNSKTASTHFIDDEEYLLKNVYSFASSDLLEHFTYVFHGMLGEMTKSFGSASWLLVEVSPTATEEEATLLHICCRNFFESIPFQERQNYYTTVRSKLLNVVYSPENDMSCPVPPSNPATAAEGASASTTPASSPAHAKQHFHHSNHQKAEGLQSLWGNSDQFADERPVDNFGCPIQRVVLIVLLHEKDMLRSLEDSLPPNVLLTRSVRDLTIEINLRNNLAELYQMCFPFEHFRDRLFGPQEDELGDDGMNPLKYAKMCRKRQIAAQELIKKAPQMNFDELRYHCRVRGLNDIGTKSDLVKRVQEAFERQLAILGFGELSAFGEDMCKRIFHRFKDESIVSSEEGDSGLSLWELNHMLFEAGSEQAIYNLIEYRNMLQEYQFRADKQGKLLPEGLTAYFERFGRLGDTIQSLGIGSLDDMLAGSIQCRVEFDNEAFSALLDMFSGNTISEWTLKRLVRQLSSLQDISIEADYVRISQLLHAMQSWLSLSLSPSSTSQQQQSFQENEEETFLQSYLRELLSSFLDAVRSPGWLAAKLHRLLEELANGDNGIIRSLRVFLMTEFSSFANWEMKFKEQIKLWKKINTPKMNSNNSNSQSNDNELFDNNDVAVAEAVEEDRSTGSNSNSNSNSKQQLTSSIGNTSLSIDTSVGKSESKSLAIATSNISSQSQPQTQQQSQQSNPTTNNDNISASVASASTSASPVRSESAAAAASAAAVMNTGLGIDASNYNGPLDAEQLVMGLLATAAAAKSEEENKQKAEQDEIDRIANRHSQIRKLEEHLQKCLPELIETNHLTEKRYEELMAKAKRVKELLSNENVHLNRSEREELRLASGKIEAEAIQLRSDLEHAKSVSAAHACALYDAMRLYARGIVSAGCGTKEVCVRATSRGFHWADLLPRAEGELSVPMQLRENKLRRAAQRKNAALAALEREQQRRKMDEMEKLKQKQENDNLKDKRVEEEERLLFAEAFDLYCIAKEERQLLPTLERLATLWEKFASLKTSRYPKTLQSIVCMNNFAVICLQFFGRSSIRWHDASMNFDNCSDLLHSFLEEINAKAVEELRLRRELQELESLGRSQSDDATSVNESVSASVSVSGKVTANAVAAIVAVSAEGVPVSPLLSPELRTSPKASQRSSSPSATATATAVEVIAALPPLPNNDSKGPSAHASSNSIISAEGGSSSSSAHPLSTSRSNAAEAEDRYQQFPYVVYGVPEALITPIIVILQNHLTYLRVIAPIDLEGKPKYEELTFRQRRAIDHNQSLIVALLAQLSEHELERVMNGIAKSVNHIPVFAYYYNGNSNGSSNANNSNPNNNGMYYSEQLNKTISECSLKIEIATKKAIEDKIRMEEEARQAAEEADQKAREEEALAQRERELRMLMADDSSASASLGELALARNEKAKKYQKQRELDKLVRERVSKHRNKLYAMIQSDDISKIFQSHAKSIDNGADYTINWGKSKDEILQSDAFKR